MQPLNKQEMRLRQSVTWWVHAVVVTRTRETMGMHSVQGNYMQSHTIDKYY